MPPNVEKDYTFHTILPHEEAKINPINKMYALLGEEDAEKRVTFVYQHDPLEGLLVP